MRDCHHAMLEEEAEAFGFINICVAWKTDPSVATGWTPTLFSNS